LSTGYSGLSERIQEHKPAESSRRRQKLPEGRLPERSTAGEVNAAIAMALYSYFGELHDRESGIVTIKRVNKPYSPWSSKLYNMRNPKIR